MKFSILCLLLLIALQGYSQKKKKEDPKDVQIDTLTKANALLTKQLDSVSKEQQLYYGVYTTIKEKVLLRDFDPEKLPQIIDSIRASRDSTTSSLVSPVASLRDSLSMVTKENALLKSKVDTMTVALNTHSANSADKAKLMAELKDLKALLDAKILTQAEYEAKKKLVMDKWL